MSEEPKTDAITTYDEELQAAWLQMDKEPDLWYQRFVKYYLPLGIGRTLLKALMAYYQTEEPEKYELALMNARQSVGMTWSQMASAWLWRDRAKQYDAIRFQEASKSIDQARTIILENTGKAAQTLVTSLDNPRTAVAAAKEILDRGGIPGTIVRENRVVPFTADELARAREEVGEWENKLQPKSDVNG